MIVHGVPTSNKKWRRHWFWVGGDWRAEFDPKHLPANECVLNEIQGQVEWSTVDLFEEQKGRIKLVLTVEEESRELARLTNELALYQGNLRNIPPKNGTDYPLKFKMGEGIPIRQASGAREFNSKDPKSMDEFDYWRNVVLIAISLSETSCYRTSQALHLLTFCCIL